MAKKKNIVSIEDRIPRLKNARKKKANRRIIFYLFVFFILISIIVYLVSPLSHVKHVEVIGDNLISKENIIHKTNIDQDTNMWSISMSKIEKEIQNNPIIKSVDVSRKWPRTISINIDEHEHVAFIKEDEKFYPVLSNGFVVSDKSIKHTDGSGPILSDFTEDTYLKKMTKQLQKLPTDILKMISEIYWQPTKESKYNILLYMNSGYVVDSVIRNFAENMKAYPSIITQLTPEDEGVIHIGIGAYFEPYQQVNEEDELKEDEETADRDSNDTEEARD